MESDKKVIWRSPIWVLVFAVEPRKAPLNPELGTGHAPCQLFALLWVKISCAPLLGALVFQGGKT